MNSSAMSALPMIVHEVDKEMVVVDVDVAEFVREVIKAIRAGKPSIDVKNNIDHFMDSIIKSSDNVELVKTEKEVGIDDTI